MPWNSLQGAEGDKTVAMALAKPDHYVLKPQREGGGKTLFFHTLSKHRKEIFLRLLLWCHICMTRIRIYWSGSLCLSKREQHLWPRDLSGAEQHDRQLREDCLHPDGQDQSLPGPELPAQTGCGAKTQHMPEWAGRLWSLCEVSTSGNGELWHESICVSIYEGEGLVCIVFFFFFFLQTGERDGDEWVCGSPAEDQELWTCWWRSGCRGCCAGQSPPGLRRRLAPAGVRWQSMQSTLPPQKMKGWALERLKLRKLCKRVASNGPGSLTRFSIQCCNTTSWMHTKSMNELNGNLLIDVRY